MDALTRGYFTNSGGVPAVALVAVWTLHKDGIVTETFSKHLPANVVEANSTTCKTLG